MQEIGTSTFECVRVVDGTDKTFLSPHLLECDYLFEAVCFWPISLSCWLNCEIQCDIQRYLVPIVVLHSGFEWLMGHLPISKTLQFSFVER